MTGTVERDHLNEAIMIALDETFDSVVGMYLDRGTSFFETLAEISAEEASRPVSARCASVAAHVAHVTFYMETLLKRVGGDRDPVDWGHIWATVEAVTPEEWAASQAALKDVVERVRGLIRETPWTDSDQIAGALAILMHNAHHLGEIRQALCTLKG